MKNNLMIIDEKAIKDKIYVIRGKQVMLDSDLAEIYGYTTKRFNEQVKNNIERFDDDFRFQLTDEELLYLSRSKKSTTMQTKGIKGGRVYKPYVFTEEGIYMLMTVLKGEIAVNQSKALIRIFKSMKDFIVDNKILEQKYINNLVLNDHEKIIEINNDINQLKNTFKKFEKKEIKNKIFFKNQTYDAYSLLLDILESSKKEIIIIDNYVNKKILDLISKTNKQVLVISKNMNKELINKYQSQYNNLIIKDIDEFHDRFIIIDRKTIYHLGSSLKDLGKSCFCISVIKDKNYLNMLLKIININYEKKTNL